jgi:putative membrane protein insertion efficiency factor
LKPDFLRETLRSAGKWILLLFVRFYQVFLSPFFGGACKFYPSCSRYGYEAIAKHGAWRGSVLAAKRLFRCRPFTKGGFDPVPDVVDEADADARELQGLKPDRTPIVNVAAEAATYKDRERPFENVVQGRPFADGTQVRPFVHSAQGKAEFAQ